MKRDPVYVMLAVALLSLFLPGAIQATGCRIITNAHHVPTVHHDVVKVVTPVVAQFVPVAIYGGVYNPYAYPVAPQAAPQYAPQHAPQAAPCADLAGTVKALSDELRSLKAQLGKPTAPHMPPAEGGSVDPFNPPQAQQADSVSRILSARCSACHDDSRAKAAGKGIVLTQGGKAKTFAPEELGAIISSVSSKQMPRGVQMPDAERIELIAALTGAK